MFSYQNFVLLFINFKYILLKRKYVCLLNWFLITSKNIEMFCNDFLTRHCIRRPVYRHLSSCPIQCPPIWLLGCFLFPYIHIFQFSFKTRQNNKISKRMSYFKYLIGHLSFSPFIGVFQNVPIPMNSWNLIVFIIRKF